MPDSFTETFAAGLAGYGNRPCLEFEECWFTGSEVTGYADGIAHKLRAAGVPEDAPVGVVVRNRLPHAAAIVGRCGGGAHHERPRAGGIAAGIRACRTARVDR